MGPAIMLVAVAAAASAPASEPPAPAEVNVTADIASMRGSSESADGPSIEADGHVHAIRGVMEVRSDHLRVFKHEGYGFAEGNVMGIDGQATMFGQRLRFDLATHTTVLENGTFILKHIEAVDLTAAFDSPNPACIRAMGANELTLRGVWIRRNADRSLDGHDVWMTNCTCPEGCRPLLSISAIWMHAVPADRASFTWSLIRLFDIPVLPLPWISMPLTDRASGLLFPLVGFTGPGGDNVGEPVFLTMGRSADFTLEPLYFFGTSNAATGGQGVRGPAGDAEIRWRPAVDSIGSFHMLDVYDTSVGPMRDNRWELALMHSQTLLGGHAGVSFSAASDSNVMSDSAVSPAIETEQYLRSWAEYSRKAGPFDLALESTYAEDLTTGELQTARLPWDRIPAVVTPVAQGTIGADNRLGWLAMHEQLTVAYEDAWAYQPAPDTPHERRLITSLALAQTLPIASGRYGILALETGERAEDLVPSDQTGLRWRGGGYAGITTRTSISRTFASGWMHEIIPALQVRGFGTAGDVPYSNGLYADRFTDNPTPLPQDEFDLALPWHPTVQAIASLESNLSPPKSPPIRFRLEQHLALLPYDAGQLRATIAVPFGLNTIALSGGRTFSAIDPGWAPADISYSRQLPGHGAIQVGARYNNAFTDDQIRRGPDLLFSPAFETPPAATAGPPPIWYTLYANAKLANLGPIVLNLTGSVGYYPYEITNNAPTLYQDYGASIFYEAPGCGRISLTLHWTHSSGQPLAAPIPSPSYEFGTIHDLATLPGM